MFNYIKHMYKINRLFIKKDKIFKEFLSLYNKEKAKKDSKKEELDLISSEGRFEVDQIDYEIEIENTSYYVKMAKIYFLEIPNYDDHEYWIESKYDYDRKVLSNKAICSLRNALREEKKYKIDQIAQLITIITGLIGVVIGLVAISN